jgi:hypothetical protein
MLLKNAYFTSLFIKENVFFARKKEYKKTETQLSTSVSKIYLAVISQIPYQYPY